MQQVGAFRSRARNEQIMQRGWVKHGKYGSRSHILTSPFSQTESQDHSRSIHRRPLCTHSCYPAAFAHNTHNVLSYIGPSLFPVMNSVLPSATPLPLPKGLTIAHFSSQVQKLNILFIRYVKSAWPRLLLLSVQSMLILWHIAVLYMLTTVLVRCNPLTL